jgi:hypothetical protein
MKLFGNTINMNVGDEFWTPWQTDESGPELLEKRYHYKITGFEWCHQRVLHKKSNDYAVLEKLPVLQPVEVEYRKIEFDSEDYIPH